MESLGLSEYRLGFVKIFRNFGFLAVGVVGSGSGKLILGFSSSKASPFPRDAVVLLGVCPFTALLDRSDAVVLFLCFLVCGDLVLVPQNYFSVGIRLFAKQKRRILFY